MTLRDQPDPGPRCDPADVEMWEQLQRALTKLDQAEQREEELRREIERLREVKGLLVQVDGAALPRHDPPERGYDLRQRFNRSIRWLREAEDIARIETPAWPTADRIRDIYEQITDDLLNGRTSVPPLRQRLKQAEAQRDALAKAGALSLELNQRLLKFIPHADSLKVEFTEKLAEARSALDALDQTNREGIQ